MEVAGYQTDLEVGVHTNLPYDVLLGRDYYISGKSDFEKSIEQHVYGQD